MSNSRSKSDKNKTPNKPTRPTEGSQSAPQLTRAKNMADEASRLRKENYEKEQKESAQRIAEQKAQREVELKKIKEEKEKKRIAVAEKEQRLREQKTDSKKDKISHDNDASSIRIAKLKAEHEKKIEQQKAKTASSIANAQKKEETITQQRIHKVSDEITAKMSAFNARQETKKSKDTVQQHEHVNQEVQRIESAERRRYEGLATGNVFVKILPNLADSVHDFHHDSSIIDLKAMLRKDLTNALIPLEMMIQRAADRQNNSVSADELRGTLPYILNLIANPNAKDYSLSTATSLLKRVGIPTQTIKSFTSAVNHEMSDIQDFIHHVRERFVIMNEAISPETNAKELARLAESELDISQDDQLESDILAHLSEVNILNNHYGQDNILQQTDNTETLDALKQDIVAFQNKNDSYIYSLNMHSTLSNRETLLSTLTTASQTLRSINSHLTDAILVSEETDDFKSEVNSTPSTPISHTAPPAPVQNTSEPTVNVNETTTLSEQKEADPVVNAEFIAAIDNQIADADKILSEINEAIENDFQPSAPQGLSEEEIERKAQREAEREFNLAMAQVSAEAKSAVETAKLEKEAAENKTNEEQKLQADADTEENYEEDFIPDVTNADTFANNNPPDTIDTTEQSYEDDFIETDENTNTKQAAIDDSETTYDDDFEAPIDEIDEEIEEDIHSAEEDDAKDNAETSYEEDFDNLDKDIEEDIEAIDDETAENEKTQLATEASNTFTASLNEAKQSYAALKLLENDAIQTANQRNFAGASAKFFQASLTAANTQRKYAVAIDNYQRIEPKDFKLENALISEAKAISRTASQANHFSAYYTAQSTQQPVRDKLIQQITAYNTSSAQLNEKLFNLLQINKNYDTLYTAQKSAMKQHLSKMVDQPHYSEIQADFEALGKERANCAAHVQALKQQIESVRNAVSQEGTMSSSRNNDNDKKPKITIMDDDITTSDADNTQPNTPNSNVSNVDYHLDSDIDNDDASQNNNFDDDVLFNAVNRAQATRTSIHFEDDDQDFNPDDQPDNDNNDDAPSPSQLHVDIDDDLDPDSNIIGGLSPVNSIASTDTSSISADTINSSLEELHSDVEYQFEYARSLLSQLKGNFSIENRVQEVIDAYTEANTRAIQLIDAIADDDSLSPAQSDRYTNIGYMFQEMASAMTHSIIAKANMGNSLSSALETDVLQSIANAKQSLNAAIDYAEKAEIGGIDYLTIKLPYECAYVSQLSQPVLDKLLNHAETARDLSHIKSLNTHLGKHKIAHSETVDHDPQARKQLHNEWDAKFKPFLDQVTDRRDKLVVVINQLKVFKQTDPNNTARIDKKLEQLTAAMQDCDVAINNVTKIGSKINSTRLPNETLIGELNIAIQILEERKKNPRLSKPERMDIETDIAAKKQSITDAETALAAIKADLDNLITKQKALAEGSKAEADKVYLKQLELYRNNNLVELSADVIISIKRKDYATDKDYQQALEAQRKPFMSGSSPAITAARIGPTAEQSMRVDLTTESVIMVIHPRTPVTSSLGGPTHLPTVATLERNKTTDEFSITINQIDQRTSPQDLRELAMKLVETYINQHPNKPIYITGSNYALTEAMKSYCDAMQNLVKDPAQKARYTREPETDLSKVQRFTHWRNVSDMESHIKASKLNLDLVHGKNTYAEKRGIFGEKFEHQAGTAHQKQETIKTVSDTLLTGNDQINDDRIQTGPRRR